MENQWQNGQGCCLSFCGLQWTCWHSQAEGAWAGSGHNQPLTLTPSLVVRSQAPSKCAEHSPLCCPDTQLAHGGSGQLVIQQFLSPLASIFSISLLGSCNKVPQTGASFPNCPAPRCPFLNVMTKGGSWFCWMTPPEFSVTMYKWPTGRGSSASLYFYMEPSPEACPQVEKQAFLSESGHIGHRPPGLTSVCFSCRMSWTWKRAWR